MKKHFAKVLGFLMILGIFSCDIGTDPCDDDDFGSIDGVVTTEMGVNLEGVSVKAISGDKEFSAITDANGYYKLDRLPEGTYEVRFEKEGFIPTFKSPVIVEEEENTKVNGQLELLITWGTILGTVLDETQAPLSGVTINIQGLNISSITDNAGNYTINEVPAGQYLLDFSKTGYVDYTSPSIRVSAGENTIVSATMEKVVPKGSISGSVKDINNNTGLADVTITSVSGTKTLSHSTNADGTYTHELPVGVYNITFSKVGYLDTVYSDVTITENTTTYLEAVLQISNSNSGLGTASGKITNAVTGSPENGVTLSLRAGINTTQGPILHTQVTDVDGNFTFRNINAGHYTAVITKANFLENRFSIVVLGGVIKDNQNYNITPMLNDNETRIVLSWGATPSDLDSHISIPTNPQGHVYYAQKIGLHTELDLDDITSYGPETITITETIAGTYTYYVHDYSNKLLSVSNALANSGAIVKVFQGSTLKATFNVPSGDGTLWKVFTLTDGVITPVNIMLYESNQDNVPNRSITSINNDLELFQNLPNK